MDRKNISGISFDSERNHSVPNGQWGERGGRNERRPASTDVQSLLVGHRVSTQPDPPQIRDGYRHATFPGSDRPKAPYEVFVLFCLSVQIKHTTS